MRTHGSVHNGNLKEKNPSREDSLYLRHSREIFFLQVSSTSEGVKELRSISTISLSPFVFLLFLLGEKVYETIKHATVLGMQNFSQLSMHFQLFPKLLLIKAKKLSFFL